MSKHICDEDFPWCTREAKAGEFYKLRVKNLSPTQFATGRAEIMVKAGRLRKKYKADPQHLHDYLRLRPVPIVVREDKFYLVDHHHLARALYEALHSELKDDICVYVEVMQNWSSLSQVHFWKAMFERHWIYLFDNAGGGPQQPEQLPKHVKDLTFDPYRSLAWIVRDKHGYLKNDMPFSEFKWANFFRTRILPSQDLLAGKRTFDEFAFEVDKHGKLTLGYDGKEIIDECMFLAASPEARGLPGYRGPAS
jgi:hypothetical protein